MATLPTLIHVSQLSGDPQQLVRWRPQEGDQFTAIIPLQGEVVMRMVVIFLPKHS